MAKARVLHKRLKVDEARRGHRCQHNRSHVIRQGDRRLKVTEGRTNEHYCLECAARFLKGSIEALQSLLAEVEDSAKQPPLDPVASPVADNYEPL